MPRKMRDSGVAWIGAIPEGWRVVAIKNLALADTSLFLDGDWINGEDLSNDGIRYFTTGNVGQGVFKDQGKGYISEETFKRLNCLEVHGGDLIISRLNEPIGRACLIPEGYKRCIVAVDCVVVRPDADFDKSFLVFAMSSDPYAEYGALLARGTTMHRISRTQLGSIKLPIPPILEQRAIAFYLDTKCSEIDAAIASARQSIEEYKALKKSLVFETVTGKRKVPTALTQRTQRSQRDAESLDRINRIYRIEGEKPAAANTENAKGSKCRKDDYEALRTSANFAFSASASAGSRNPVNPVNPVEETARPMRDSGIAWIGAIPEGWRVVQLKRIAKIQTGNTPPKSENSPYYSDESGVPWIKGSWRQSENRMFAA